MRDRTKINLDSFISWEEAEKCIASLPKELETFRRIRKGLTPSPESLRYLRRALKGARVLQAHCSICKKEFLLDPAIWPANRWNCCKKPISLGGIPNE